MDKLANAYFFRDLDRHEIELVRKVTRILEAKSGYLILRQGQPSDDLYIVRSGSVRVMLPSPAPDEEPSDQAEHTLVVLGPGECFGEFAFIDRKPSSASVLANEDSTLYGIFHADLERVLESNPMTAAKVYRSMLDILVGRFRNTDIELAVRRAVGA